MKKLAKVLILFLLLSIFTLSTYAGDDDVPSVDSIGFPNMIDEI